MNGFTTENRESITDFTDVHGFQRFGHGFAGFSG
jgi:hypothetical protein